MKTFLVGVVLFGVTTGAPAQDVEQELKQVAQSVDAAIAKRDAASLGTLLAEGFEFVHSTGRLEDRASFIRRAAAGQLASQGNAGDQVEDRLRMHDTTGIRTTLTLVRLPGSASATQIYTRYVYVKGNGSWRLVSAQSTIVAKPASPK